MPRSSNGTHEETTLTMKSRMGFSLVFGTIAVCHLIWPTVAIDATTVALVVLALLPWMGEFVNTIEVFGMKIGLREVQNAFMKILTSAGAQGKQSFVKPSDLQPGSYREDMDPNLEFVRLRIGVEERLAKLVAGSQARPDDAGAMVDHLLSERRITVEMAIGLRELIKLGNKAAHGARVTPPAAKWARETGPEILRVLDELVTEKSGGSPNQ